MKALKSELAKSLLADPAGRKQLREYMDRRRPGEPTQEQPFTIHFRGQDGREIQVRPRVVPKAA